MSPRVWFVWEVTIVTPPHILCIPTFHPVPSVLPFTSLPRHTFYILILKDFAAVMTRKILEEAEMWEGDDDNPKYVFTTILYSDKGKTYVANNPTRKIENIDIEKLEGDLIVPETVNPAVDSATFTLCPDPTSSSVFVKRPCLIDYKPGDNSIKEVVLKEIQVCEELKKFSHANVAEYLGCQVQDSLITGLCFKKYETTLSNKVKEARDSFDHRLCIESIRSGIEHLHRHGYCHNDINPANIMFDANGTVVIIDFDSCVPEGEKLVKGGTPFFCDERDWSRSEPRHDFYGLDKIEKFLEEESG